MPAPSGADTIRILVASDSHVGYCETDAVRGDDSWKAFDEVMALARTRDVDMVLLAGDLFHDNKPSAKSQYNVARSIRMNCLGDKPCELEMLSDASDHFDGTFTHANYEDENINVAIPVFSIHGNHDDPSGEGHFSALDLLQVQGLVNYYGKTPESDNIEVKPVLLQKGHTKLALYGLSNVRDERLYRTFRQEKVKFFRPSTQKGNWFNLLSVHQNHHKYSETGWLPEKFLPDFMQLVVWGHEHECDIEPKRNFEQGFYVMQPGSSVATSLSPGEAVKKHVAILSITGKDFECEKIPLRNVRPFVMKEIVLQDEPGMKALAKKENNRTAITRHLETIVNGMIKEAEDSWRRSQDPNGLVLDEPPPAPLVRLRVEYTAPEGGKYDIENEHRFSNRFSDRVANGSNVVQFHRKKATARRTKAGTELPDEEALSKLGLDNVKVEKLVREYLQAQSLTILPQNLFGDAVSQFIEKDDKHAMESFVAQSLDEQVKNLIGTDDVDFDEDAIALAISTFRTQLEDKFDKGQYKLKRSYKMKPKPAGWDSDLEGSWEDQPAALILSDGEEQEPVALEDDQNVPARSSKGRGRGGAVKTTKTATPAKSAKAPARGGRAKKPLSTRKGHGKGGESSEDSDVVMLDDMGKDSEEVASSRPSASAASRSAPARSTRAKQTTLSFSQTQAPSRQNTATSRGVVHELSDDEISDDDDAFDPAPSTSRTNTRR